MATLQGIRRLSDLQALAQAIDLLRQRARVPLVMAATGLPAALLRRLYGQLHGRRPPSGPGVQRLANRLETRRQRIHAALFATLYGQLPGDNGERPDIGAVRRAHACYRRLVPADPEYGGLDLNAAWAVARALHAGLAVLHSCQQCGAPWLRVTGLPPLCPVCGRRVTGTDHHATAEAAGSGTAAVPPIPPNSAGSLPTARWHPNGPRGIRNLEDCTRLQLAWELLARQARGSIVAAATGLPLPAVHALCRELRPGTGPVKGPLPTGAGALLRPHRQHVHAALFALLYQRRMDGASRRLNAADVIAAYDHYRMLAPADGDRYGLDFNAAWVIARDLRAGLIRLRHCDGCGAPYLEAPEQFPLCPLCSPRCGGTLYHYRRRFPCRADSGPAPGRLALAGWQAD